MEFELPDEIKEHLFAFMSRNEFTIIESSRSEMGEWFVNMENKEFILAISCDRGGSENIEIGSKIRPKKGAPLRSWSLSHLRGFEDGLEEHYKFKSFSDQSKWLESNETAILNTAALNSEALREWAVKASKRLFG